MNDTERRNNEICYICGENRAVNWDHIPPKCIFPDSLKDQNVEKIKVRSCEACNNSMSKIDEKVRDHLSLCIFTRFREELWAKTEKKLKKSPRLRDEMIKNMIPLEKIKIDPKYIKQGSTHAIKLPKEFDDFVLRLFKGFHTYYTGVIIDESYSSEVWHYPRETLDENMKFVNRKFIISDVMVLLGAISTDKKMSMWWLQLYNNPLFISIIAPKAIFRKASVKLRKK